ncbi:MAG: hypothetical protein ACHQNT_03785 [Bacteroidia bacterium]
MKNELPRLHYIKECCKRAAACSVCGFTHSVAEPARSVCGSARSDAEPAHTVCVLAHAHSNFTHEKNNPAHAMRGLPHTGRGLRFADGVTAHGNYGSADEKERLADEKCPFIENIINISAINKPRRVPAKGRETLLGHNKIYRVFFNIYFFFVSY